MKTGNSNRYVPLVAVLLIVILLPFGYSIVKGIFVTELPESGLFLELPDDKYENCIRDTEYMRLHHWELLLEMREGVVRYGKRSDISLSKCRDCHTSREKFCNRCHDAVSLAPDCFGCHYYPELDSAISNKSHAGIVPVSDREILAAGNKIKQVR